MWFTLIWCCVLNVYRYKIPFNDLENLGIDFFWTVRKVREHFFVVVLNSNNNNKLFTGVFTAE